MGDDEAQTHNNKIKIIICRQLDIVFSVEILL